MRTNQNSGLLLFQNLFGSLCQRERFARSVRPNYQHRWELDVALCGDGNHGFALLCIQSDNITNKIRFEIRVYFCRNAVFRCINDDNITEL